MKKDLPSGGPFSVEQHYTCSMISPHPGAFLKGPEGMVLSVVLRILKGDGADQTADLIVLLLPQGDGVGF